MALASFAGLVLGIVLVPLVGSLILGFTVASLFGSLIISFMFNNQYKMYVVEEGDANVAKETTVEKDVETGAEKNHWLEEALLVLKKLVRQSYI